MLHDWFSHVLYPQGNVAFESPWSAWRRPAVCWMGTPRSAAGKEAVPLETVLNEYWHTGGGSSVRISMASQISHMVCLSWTDKCCDQKSFMRIIRDLRIPGQTLLYLTSFNIAVQPHQFYFPTPALWKFSVADGIWVVQPEACSVWGCWCG